jgi:hypothetical protein
LWCDVLAPDRRPRFIVLQTASELEGHHGRYGYRLRLCRPGHGHLSGQHRPHGARRGKDARKLKTLQDGHCPIFEPGLQELMQENYASGQLQFTADVKAAVKDAEVVFLCVGTPPKPDGTVDMTYLEQAGKEVCDALAENNNDYMVTIIVKSTVPAGHQPQALQLPQDADEGARPGRQQPGVPQGRHGGPGLPATPTASWSAARAPRRSA